MNICALTACVLAVSSWIMPQPKLSRGWLVLYGNQRLVQANAAFHGYTLADLPGECGLAAISPAHLGQLAWVSVDGLAWVGPCRVVDAGGRGDALWLLAHHEVAEVSRATAAALGFTHGAPGYIWFGACPPADVRRATPYAPPLVLDQVGQATPSFYPYPAAQPVIKCDERAR